MADREFRTPSNRLTPPGEAAAVGLARRQVLDFLAPHGLSRAVVFKVELVLEEALMNIVSYAFSGAGPHEIGLTVTLDDGQVVLCFEDDGMAFDPLQVQPPPTPTSIEEAVPGGLGIALMRRAATSIQYRRSGDRNELTIGVARR
jgi:anti-sigma regulatory factor (Ser/Thr protein kinase)